MMLVGCADSEAAMAQDTNEVTAADNQHDDDDDTNSPSQVM